MRSVMSSETWVPTRLRTAVDLLAGYAFKSVDFDETASGPRLVRGASVGAGELIDQPPFLPAKKVTNDLSRYELRAGDLVLAMDGTWSGSGLKWCRIQRSHLPALLVQRVARLRANGPLTQGFLRCLVASPNFSAYIRAVETGTTISHISATQILNFEFPCPSLAEQRRIAGLIETLDAKIEASRRLFTDLLGTARAIFDAAREEAAEEVSVADIAVFHNRQRVPLSAGERAEMPGPFPYYGATGIFDHVGRFLFDGVFALIGEDGSVIHGDGTPVSQYVWGRLWVNNHAHVISGGAVSTELAYLALSRTDVRAHVTGAVQAKLSMGNLKAVPLTIPAASVRAAAEDAIRPIFDLMRATHDKASTLEHLRDALLPKLVAGQICVSEDYDPGDRISPV